MFIGQCIHDLALSHGLYISLFLAGIVGGFTHCSAMCTPFVLAQCDHMTQQNTHARPLLRRLKSSLLLPYHAGRITTYTAIAVIMAGLVNMVFLFSNLKSLIAAPLLLLAATFFLVSAFPRLGALFPWNGGFKLALPHRFVSRALSATGNKTGIVKSYLLGLLLGFMPCGLVISAVLAAVSTPNIIQTAAAMMAFGAGTIPALILIAFGGQSLKHKYPKFSGHFSRGAMAVSALWLFALAGTMLF